MTNEYETIAISCGWGKTLSWEGYESPGDVINRMAVEGWEWQQTIPGYDDVMAEHCRPGTLVFRRARQ